MSKRALGLAAACGALLAAGSTAALAQAGGPRERCQSHAGIAEASSRDAALRLAWEAILETSDPRSRRIWAERGQRIGDAPGFNVTRIVTRCTPRGRGYSCQIDTTLCRG
jgi:hypothetical protein